MIEKRAVNEPFSKETTVSGMDMLVGPEAVYMSDQERTATKLRIAMEDRDVAMALDVYMRQLIVPGMVEQGRLTSEQGDRILEGSSQTLGLLQTPLQKQQADQRVSQYVTRGKTSPFKGK